MLYIYKFRQKSIKKVSVICLWQAYGGQAIQKSKVRPKSLKKTKPAAAARFAGM